MSPPAEAQAPPAAGDAPPPTPVAVGDWPVEDDFLLRESVEAGAALGAIARGILPFSKPYTREDITRRWRCVRSRARHPPPPPPPPAPDRPRDPRAHPPPSFVRPARSRSGARLSVVLPPPPRPATCLVLADSPPFPGR